MVKYVVRNIMVCGCGFAGGAMGHYTLLKVHEWGDALANAMNLGRSFNQT